MTQTLRPNSTRFSNEQTGAAAVEYALLVALIAAVIIGTVFILGGYVGSAYDSVVGRF